MTNDAEESDGILTGRSNNVLWTILAGYITLGSAGGLAITQTTQDRITGAEFAAEIRARDIQIENGQRRLEIIEDIVFNLPPESVTKIQDDHELRIRTLEKEKMK